MNMKIQMTICLATACLVLAVGPSGCSNKEAKSGASGDGVAMTTCDGQGEAVVSKDANGKILADALMDQWKRDHPDRDWVAEEKERHELKPPADNSALLEAGQGEGHTYGRVTERDLTIWASEAEKFALEGSRIFHSADLLQSQTSVSCDMCHPHASNTHPETYPKFQAQLGRAVLLRDMINWCIENPVRGPRLDGDDARMRALEAYILAQRSGTAMNYGKQ
jgi:hypothetical protein